MPSPQRTPPARLVAVAMTAVGLSLSLVTPRAGAGSVPTAPAGSAATDGSSATSRSRALLGDLRRAPEGPRSGYDRSVFVHWIDADGNGCDTRHEVLIAESMVPPQVGAGCSVSGRWTSAYDGVSTTDDSSFDIDHMVPLAEAWDSGATGWHADRRKQFANDLDLAASLVAVSASSNRSKGDSDPAEWLPPRREAWCSYAADWVAVKARWDLSADDAEVAALGRALDTCAEFPGGAGMTVSSLDCAGEQVTVFNAGPAGVSLSGWTLHDAGAAHTFAFPAGSQLASRASATIRSGGTAGAGELAWTTGNVWNNDGDTASLVDPAGTTRSSRSC